MENLEKNLEQLYQHQKKLIQDLQKNSAPDQKEIETFISNYNNSLEEYKKTAAEVFTKLQKDLQ